MWCVFVRTHTKHLPLVAEAAGCVLLLHRWVTVKARPYVCVSVCPAHSCAGVESHSQSPGPLLHQCRLTTAGTDHSPPPQDYKQSKIKWLAMSVNGNIQFYSELNTFHNKTIWPVISGIHRSVWNSPSHSWSWSTAAYLMFSLLIPFVNLLKTDELKKGNTKMCSADVLE